MRRLHLDQDIKPVSDFRANAASMIRTVRDTRRPLVLTQRGHSAAVVLDVAEYEYLIGELELLRDLHAATQEVADGKGVPHEIAKKRVLDAISR